MENRMEVLHDVAICELCGGPKSEPGTLCHECSRMTVFERKMIRQLYLVSETQKEATTELSLIRQILGRIADQGEVARSAKTR